MTSGYKEIKDTHILWQTVNYNYPQRLMTTFQEKYINDKVVTNFTT